jgi:hypothetical protein
VASLTIHKDIFRPNFVFGPKIRDANGPNQPLKIKIGKNSELMSKNPGLDTLASFQARQAQNCTSRQSSIRRFPRNERPLRILWYGTGQLPYRFPIIKPLGLCKNEHKPKEKSG